MKKTSKTLRADAAKVLYQILENGQSSRESLPKIQELYSDKDKAWLQEMVFGVLRQLPVLQSWLRQLLDKPLKNKYKVAEHLIMLGFYQLAFTRVSTHAAVSETVAAARQLKVEPLKGLINALLRNFIRQELAQQTINDPQVSSGLPKWLFKRLQVAYPEQLEELCVSMQQKPPIWLRINTRQTNVESFKKRLDEQGVEYSQSEEHLDGLILSKGQDITQLPGYQQGLFAVQDGAAQLAAGYLDTQENDLVLDCCAAPGGKTCHILERQPNLQKCIALDIDDSRLDRVRENLTRLNLDAELVAADALDTSSWWDGQLFDRILLDAPCSATGVIRRHPDIKWLRKNADIEALVDLQKQILATMWQLLKPGGTLVYATCSILPEENHLQITEFLNNNGDATLSKLSEHDKISPPGRQILPGEKQMDGFYYARLLKSSNAT
ncbi:16S rRNA (cytosine(967)-C(5))-methyltransferase RsmB [Aliiglaciecola sp. 3_MG-2023]|uniref:16S rRNA (cytosine(967)-C(5))-methyltransferase RsmB n=1 Tax=Aliiglaciecola sp. 3_MG-2023 TaxID=3062644 RepID=UPI0026E38C64|nr:16S rRNA (cytosine(967)-C(5))-methyltransferase RsmB [Aliiglaciecola sp. 3_MG-2023]MDO6695601.1 16S rRNA (cytosine(967)-C(5))-methyltransferase RsmB [Aliiglaciecola sp. 3_MG-2023]